MFHPNVFKTFFILSFSLSSISLKQHIGSRVNQFCRSCHTNSIWMSHSSSDASQPDALKQKVIAIIRHGQTECNEYLHGHEWGCNNFKDPELWDTILSQTGRKQAGLLNYRIINNPEEEYKNLLKAELFVSSPLTRALQTTELVFKNTIPFISTELAIPKIALPLAAERVYLSSDVGQSRNVLEKEFPMWDFSLLPSSKESNQEVSWWYKNTNFKEASRTRTRTLNSKYIDTSSPINSKRQKGSDGNVLTAGTDTSSSTIVEGTYVDTSEYTEWRPKGYYAVAGEPYVNFRQRMINLRQWLIDRPEKFMVLTCHWGVARALTGASLLNCEVKYVKIDEILEEPFVDDAE